MKGVFIPGFEMPETCDECPLFRGDFPCSLADKVMTERGLEVFCPLVPMDDEEAKS